jgi:hypothetical protein
MVWYTKYRMAEIELFDAIKCIIVELHSAAQYALEVE